MKVLIADSDEVLASCYADELAEEGYLVVRCSDSAQLMDAIVAERPDLILMDTKMVMHPGEGLKREIENRLSLVPPILYMSDSRLKHRNWLLSSDSFVIKTRNLQVLKRKVISTLSGRLEQEKPPAQVPQKQMTFHWQEEGNS